MSDFNNYAVFIVVASIISIKDTFEKNWGNARIIK